MPHCDDAVAVFAGAQAATAADDGRLIVPRWQPADWRMLFAHTKALQIAAGNAVIQKDATERTLYFVASGLLEVTVILSSHSLAPLAKIEPGSVIGELAFLDGKPRSAKVWAVVDTMLCALEYEDYRRFADANPALASELIFGIARLVAVRLRRTLALAAG